MTTKTLGVVLTSLMFAGAVAFAQQTTNPYATGQTQTQTQTGTQQPYTSGQTGTMGQQQPYTSGQPSTQQQPYTTGQPSTTGQQNPYATGQTGTMGQQNPYTSGQTGMTQTRQYTGTVTSLQPNKEVTVQTSSGKSHKYNLSTGANTTINPNVASGSQVLVTEGKDASGRKVVTITPASPTGASTQQGTSGTSGQTQY